MKIEWSSKITDKSGRIISESDYKPNLIMDAAAAIYLHLLEQPVSGSYGKFTHIIFTDGTGTMNTDQIFATDEIHRLAIVPEDVSVIDNVIQIPYLYENVSEINMVVLGKGLVCGGTITTQSGILFSKYLNDTSETIPPNCILSGNIIITVEV